jgi:acyl carrier protein
MSNVRETVRAFVLRQFVVDEGSAAFADDANLEDCGILDSFAILNLASFIEREFHVQLESEDFEAGRLLTLVNIEDLVLNRRGARQ